MATPGIKIVDGKVVPTGTTKSLTQIQNEQIATAQNPPPATWDPFSLSQQYILNEILAVEPTKYYTKNPAGGWNEAKQGDPGARLGLGIRDLLMKHYGMYDPRSDPNNPTLIKLSDLVELPNTPGLPSTGQPSNVGPLTKRWGLKGTRPGKNSGWVIGPDGKGRWVEDITTIDKQPTTPIPPDWMNVVRGKGGSRTIRFNGRTITVPLTPTQNTTGVSQISQSAPQFQLPQTQALGVPGQATTGKPTMPQTVIPSWWGNGNQTNKTKPINLATAGKGIQMPSWWDPKATRSKSFTRQWMPKKLY